MFRLPASKPRPLRDLLLVHELIFIALILLAVGGGAYGINQWEKSAEESQRIHNIIQEIQQTRGGLYRQMKELFDTFFLNDTEAKIEHGIHSQLIHDHFVQLNQLTVGTEEKQVIGELESSYKKFADEVPALFQRYKTYPNQVSRKLLYIEMGTGIFNRYEAVSKHAVELLILKQTELAARMLEVKRVTIAILIIPILLAGLLFFLSRLFLKRAIVEPIDAIIRAAKEISVGNLQHKAPESGAAELATLAQEINKMATELQNIRIALVQSEKQAAMGFLVPMLAHNIRNPLASIRATAQMLEEPDQSEHARESLLGIINTVDRLERWTGGLLAYLHPIRPRLKVTQFDSILKGALLPLNQKIKDKKITIITKTEKAQAAIHTDEHLLEQVFYNLISNAIDASPKSCSINIEATLENKFFICTIADEGIGMPFIPDPNAATPGPSSKRFGTGLGIPFAFKVCEVLGGSLKFEAIEPQGTRITLVFPQ